MINNTRWLDKVLLPHKLNVIVCSRKKKCSWYFATLMFLHFNIELLLYFINPMCYIYSTLQLLSISYYIVLQYVLCSTDIAFFFLSILQDCDIVDRCLTAINALASYHFKERLGGRGGLSSQLMESEGSNGKLQESISSHFLRLLLQLLLFEDFR